MRESNLLYLKSVLKSLPVKIVLEFQALFRLKSRNEEVDLR